MNVIQQSNDQISNDQINDNNKTENNQTTIDPEFDKLLNEMGLTKESFMCPISHQYFRYPVLAEDGHTYEEAYIKECFKTNTKSPLTRQSMGITLRKDHIFNTILKKFYEKNPELKIYDEGYLIEDINNNRYAQDMIEEYIKSLYEIYRTLYKTKQIKKPLNKDQKQIKQFEKDLTNAFGGLMREHNPRNPLTTPIENFDLFCQYPSSTFRYNSFEDFINTSTTPQMIPPMVRPVPQPMTPRPGSPYEIDYEEYQGDGVLGQDYEIRIVQEPIQIFQTQTIQEPVQTMVIQQIQEPVQLMTGNGNERITQMVTRDIQVPMTTMVQREIDVPVTQYVMREIRVAIRRDNQNQTNMLPTVIPTITPAHRAIARAISPQPIARATSPRVTTTEDDDDTMSQNRSRPSSIERAQYRQLIETAENEYHRNIPVSQSQTEVINPPINIRSSSPLSDTTEDTIVQAIEPDITQHNRESTIVTDWNSAMPTIDIQPAQSESTVTNTNSNNNNIITPVDKVFDHIKNNIMELDDSILYMLENLPLDDVVKSIKEKKLTIKKIQI